MSERIIVIDYVNGEAELVLRADDVLTPLTGISNLINSLSIESIASRIFGINNFSSISENFSVFLNKSSICFINGKVSTFIEAINIIFFTLIHH